MERVGYRKSRDHVCREIRHNRISKSEGEHLIDRYAFQVNVTPFFNWLGVSASGQDWFKKHKLAKTNYLISDEQSEFEVVVLPTKLDKLSSNCEQSKSQFLKFHKGLSI
jgi:hypothetical protein